MKRRAAGGMLALAMVLALWSPALLQRTACLLQRQGAWQSAAAREFITLARENAITIEQENRQSLA